MNEKDVLKFLKEATNKQLEEIMLKFDTYYNEDDESLIKKGKVLAWQYINANEKDRTVIDDVLINLCGYSVKNLIRFSLGLKED